MAAVNINRLSPQKLSEKIKKLPQSNLFTISVCKWHNSLAEINIIHKKEHCSGKLYWFYKDYPDGSIVLSNLFVYPEQRNKKHGTFLQEFREQIANELGFKTVQLFVKKNSWLVDWYKRRGYEENGDCENIKNNIWMIKNIGDQNEQQNRSAAKRSNVKRAKKIKPKSA